MFCRLAWMAVLGTLSLLTADFAAAQVVSGTATFGSATSGREAEMVRQWYRDYLGREPGAELAAWVRLLQQGMSPLDAQATILGSDELFEQQGNDPTAFVTATLESVTWTSPDEATLRRWLSRYQALRGDRVTLAREILLSTQGEGTQAKPIDVATAILADSQSLARLAERELGGTLTGRQLSLRCAALTDAADSMRRSLMLRTASQEPVRQASAELLRAYAAVQEILFRIPGSAPASSAAARRIGGQISDLGDLLRIDEPPPEVIDYDPRALLQHSSAVNRGVRSVIQLFESQSNLSLAHRSALRDLAQLEGDVEQFTSLVRRGVSLDRLRWENDEINERAETLRGPLLSGSPPLFTRVLWLSVESGLSQLRQSLRDVGQSGSVPPRPDPMPPNPAPRPDPYERLIRMIDGTIGQMDTFSAALNPLAYRIPEVPAIARQLRAARTKVLELRHEAEHGVSGSRLRETQRLAFLEFRLASDPWAEVLLKYRIAGLPTLARVEAGMREISAELRSEVPPTDPGPRPPRPLPPRPEPPRPEPPAPDRRIAELVSSMQDRLNKVDQQVAPLQRYNEARTILSNSRQLATNGRRVVELVAAGRRPSELSRTIAAMQLLSERLDSDTRELDRKLHDSKVKDETDRANTARREWHRARSIFRDLQDAVGR